MMRRVTGIACVAMMLAGIGCGGDDGGTTGTGGGIQLAFLGAVQLGGVSGTDDSTALTLTFDIDPATLTVDHISVNGATKGLLSGSGTTRTLGITNIVVDNEGEIEVSIAPPPGFTVTGSPRAATVFRRIAVGQAYGGGVIAYLLQTGDPGHDPDTPHGLIASTADLNAGNGVVWAVTAFQSTAVPGGTGTALGTGAANTDAIIAQNGAGTNYAAGLARAYDGGGKTDWYLPSRNELGKLHENRAAIGGFPSEASYWSSSDDPSEGYLAWYLLCSDGNSYQTFKNDDRFRVRVVRSF